MIKEKTITVEEINWFVDNCVVNNMEGFTHLCTDCPIKTECKEIWGNLWGSFGRGINSPPNEQMFAHCGRSVC